MRTETLRNSESSLISVVLPVYNERNVLETLVERITTVLNDGGWYFEILFVNDGSSDGCTELLDQICSTREGIKAIHLSRNFGHPSSRLPCLS